MRNAALCRVIAKRVGVAWVTGARNQLARHPTHRHDGAGSTDPRPAGFAEMQARPMAFASLPGWTNTTSLGVPFRRLPDAWLDEKAVVYWPALVWHWALSMCDGRRIP
jgi:hypothetical protein